VKSTKKGDDNQRITLCFSSVSGVYLKMMADYPAVHTLRAYAKINLGLIVTGERPDGYHNIETIFHRVALFDEIFLRPAAEIIVESSDAAAPGDETNLCYKAARLLKDHLGIDAGVRCTLRKSIPVGAGLGGGSADGAALLHSLPQLWGKEVDPVTLRAMALRLGSDVPYFLDSGSAFAQGRGELLDYFALDVPYTILLCSPSIHVSSAWAYRQITGRQRSDGDLRTIVLRGMDDPRILRDSLMNDFEIPVFAAFPVVRALKDDMFRQGAVFAAMSGSGSSVFGFFTDAIAAGSAAELFRAKGYRTFITPPHFRV